MTHELTCLVWQKHIFTTFLILATMIAHQGSVNVKTWKCRPCDCCKIERLASSLVRSAAMIPDFIDSLCTFISVRRSL